MDLYIISSILSIINNYEDTFILFIGIQRECIILKKTNIHVVEGNIVTQKVCCFETYSIIMFENNAHHYLS